MQKYFNTIVNDSGTGLNGALVRVTQSSGIVASIYSDNGVTPAANPLISDGSGNFQFYAADGTYTLTITYNGKVVKTLAGVVLGSDAASNEDLTALAANLTNINAAASNLSAINTAAQNIAAIQGAAGNAQAAATSATAAQSAQTAAEAARDSVNTTGKVFADTATGLAGTANGQTFAVLDASLQFWIVYKNNAGVAQEMARSYTKAYLDSIISAQGYELSPNLLQWIDANQRLLGYFAADGTFVAKSNISLGVANGLSLTRQADGRYVLSLGTTSGVLPIGVGSIESGDYNDDVIAQQLDSVGRVLWRVQRDGYFIAKLPQSAEVISARGSAVDLPARLAPMIRLDGLPTAPVYGEWNLREMRRILAGIRAGEANTQLRVAHVGDSWTDSQNNGLQNLVRNLQGIYGNAGAGFVGVERGAADPTKATVAKTGTWAVTQWGVPAPHIWQIASSTAGSRFTLNALEAADAVRLFYLGGAGSIQYRYNGGAWTALALAGAGTQAATLAAPPAGAFTLDVEIVAGLSTIYGAEMQRNANGIRSHKLGASGSALRDWINVDGPQWQAGLSLLAPDLAVVMFGTNDTHQYPADTFAGYLTTMVGRIRAAAPLADILIVSPPRNLSTNAIYNLTDLAYASRAVAAAQECAHLDLQAYFGATPPHQVSPTWYGDTGRQYMLSTDMYHPSKPKGADVITEALFRILKD